ncbi:hypothetical protein C8R44DRAFT_160629 [Mycena epipterygia]|nr:hypothetical protein C8R44DRAFT_160629 [Mycena epipterygia]
MVNQFTHADDTHLVEYLAKYNPGVDGRCRRTIYELLVHEHKWSWTCRHPWPSWRHRYSKNRVKFDKQIKNYQEKNGLRTENAVSMERGPFTDEDDEHLVEYLAEYNPGDQGRSGPNIYQLLVENADGNWSWSSRHSGKSWLRRYQRNKACFNQRIMKYQKENGLPTENLVSAAGAPFTDEDDEHLVEYLAKYNPGVQGRCGPKIYQLLVENEHSKWGWSEGHSWNGWLQRYQRNKEWFNQRIVKYQKENGLLMENTRKLLDPSSDDESDVTEEPKRKRKRPSTGCARKRLKFIGSEDESSSSAEDNTVTGPESDDLSETAPTRHRIHVPDSETSDLTDLDIPLTSDPGNDEDVEKTDIGDEIEVEHEREVSLAVGTENTCTVPLTSPPVRHLPPQVHVVPSYSRINLSPASSHRWQSATLQLPLHRAQTSGASRRQALPQPSRIPQPRPSPSPVDWGSPVPELDFPENARMGAISVTNSSLTQTTLQSSSSLPVRPSPSPLDWGSPAPELDFPENAQMGVISPTKSAPTQTPFQVSSSSPARPSPETLDSAANAQMSAISPIRPPPTKTYGRTRGASSLSKLHTVPPPQLSPPSNEPVTPTDRLHRPTGDVESSSAHRAQDNIADTGALRTIPGLSFTDSPFTPRSPPTTSASAPTRSPGARLPISAKDRDFLEQLGLQHAIAAMAKNQGFDTEVVRNLYERSGDLAKTDKILLRMRKRAEEEGLAALREAEEQH